MGTYHRSVVGALTGGGLKGRRGRADPSIMTNTQMRRFGATIITTTTILAGGIVGQASAQPDPYERGYASPEKVAKVVRHARMVPRPGARVVVSSPCGTPSKAARLVKCGRSLMMARPYGRG